MLLLKTLVKIQWTQCYLVSDLPIFSLFIFARSIVIVPLNVPYVKQFCRYNFVLVYLCTSVFKNCLSKAIRSYVCHLCCHSVVKINLVLQPICVNSIFTSNYDSNFVAYVTFLHVMPMTLFTRLRFIPKFFLPNVVVHIRKLLFYLFDKNSSINLTANVIIWFRG